ncbi:aminotransferase [Acidisphaera sp. L21]|uniref:aminotransferase n=1 Tax=Acidisphaera sp. L21 TaxID=1641851 RepID=UPI00131D2CB5|nr:aminotransferase [Acidisphaera sp. L21]
MKPANELLSGIGTTIFTVMSALATQHGAINLGQGFPDSDGPLDVLAAAAAALTDGRNQYPPLTGVTELRQAVAAANARFYGLDVDPATEVVVTSGATEAITASLMALLNPGDEVVLIEPLYDTYLPIVRMLGAVPRLVRLEPPKWDLPRTELAAAFGPKTKAILLNTPMNPTSKVFTNAELAFIADLLVKHDAYAVCDEVYEHLTYDGWRHVPLMTLPGLRDRCLRIGSAGKTFSLTGWKVGYITAPAPLALLAARAHQNLTFTTPPNLQRAVAVGLAKDDAYFQGLASALEAKRDRLSAGLAGLGMTVLPSQGSYFVSVDYSPLGFAGDDVAFCRHITEQARVTAIPLTAFYDASGGPAPSHYARFAFCKADAILDEAVARLRQHFTARSAARLTATG